MENLLVTGAAGYIGSHVCKALHSATYSPIGLDSLIRGKREAVKWGPLVESDVLDMVPPSVFLRHGPVSGLIHCAGVAYVAESFKIPEVYWHVNATGTLCALYAVKRAGAKYIVYSSSCSVYAPSHYAMTEESPLGPLSPYGRTKAAAEALIADYCRAHGMRYVILRYFNAAGADPGGELGYGADCRLVPAAILALRGQQKPPERIDADDKNVLKINGNRHDTPDGTCIRDYVHVSDLADAHVKAVQYLESGGESRILNLGTGYGHSVLEVVGAVERVTGLQVPVEYVEEREGDAPRLIASAALAKSVLEWEPKYRLDDMVRHAWEWEKRQV